MKTLVVKSCSKLQKLIDRIEPKSLNFIPTMGNLHEGHFSLIRKAKKKGGLNLVSIYVNPLQFNNKNDFKNYPRTLKKDLIQLRKLEVDLIFLPKTEFNSLDSVTIKLGKISEKLCGKYREGHFEGVATIILKFLLIIKPNRIFLGEKDYQQILVIKKIIKDFNLKVKVEIISTIRNADGVALSSRNSLIKNPKKLKKIINCLNKIKSRIMQDNFLQSDLEIYSEELMSFGIEKVNYLEILKEKELDCLDNRFSKCRIFISCIIEGVNFIDNIKVSKKLVLKKNYIRVASS